MDSPFIPPEEVKALLDAGAGALLLDVRSPEEYREWHIAGSLSIPLPELGSRLAEIPKGSQIVTVCAHGMRSERARQFLAVQGYQARTMQGGMVQWNRVYDIATLDAEGAQVLQFRRVGKGCLSYLLIKGAEAAVIDPSMDTEVYLQEARRRGANLLASLDTHTHADHVSGGHFLARQGIPYFSPDQSISIPHQHLAPGSLSIGPFAFQVLPAPGHTPEGVVYLLGGLAFTGDTLFVESVGRPDLGQDPGPNSAVLWETLQRLLALPSSTRILPAHYSPAVQLQEKSPLSAPLQKLKALPALRMSRQEFVRWASVPSRTPPNFEAIKAINRGQELPEEDEIRELEAGPNRCAVR